MAAAGAEPHLERNTSALLTPIPNGKVLAAIGAINGIAADVIETPAGAFAVLADDSAAQLASAAQAVSAFIKDKPLLAMERRDGHITITRWLAGTRGETLPPGLALDSAPGPIVKLMMGTATIEAILAENPASVHSGRMGRLKAFRELRKLAKQARKQQAGS